MESILERICRLLEERGKKESELCRVLNITQSTFFGWKQRNTDPKANHLPKIAEFLDVSIDYLISGEEKERYYLDDEVADMAQEIYDKPELRILFDATRNVSTEDLQFVVDMVNRLKKGDE